jgi:hypothetical protein
MFDRRQRQPHTSPPVLDGLAKLDGGVSTLHSQLSAVLAESQLQKRLLWVILGVLTSSKAIEATGVQIQATVLPGLSFALVAGLAWLLYKMLAVHGKYVRGDSKRI